MRFNRFNLPDEFTSPQIEEPEGLPWDEKKCSDCLFPFTNGYTDDACLTCPQLQKDD